jgi:hypothetical protein
MKSRPPLALLIASLFLFSSAAWAQTPAPSSAVTSAELLARTKALLAADKDFFAQVSVTDEARPSAAGPGPAADYFYFRSDARSARLLYQTRPAFLAGYAYLFKAGLLQGFNPDCGCASEIDPGVMRSRAGFGFADLDPRPLLEAASADKVRPARAGSESVLVFAIARAKNDQGPDAEIAVSAATGLPVRIDYLNADGAPERTVEYLAWFEIGNKYFPRLVRITDRGGARLTLEAGNVSYNPLPDFVFTKAYLEELSR